MSSKKPETVSIPQLETQAQAHLLDIFYPLGDRQQVTAVYRGPWAMSTGEMFISLSVPATRKIGERTGVFDELLGLCPLCVVVDTATSRVLYEPRMLLQLEGFSGEIREKFLARLCALPHWPQLLEMASGRGGDLFLL